MSKNDRYRLHDLLIDASLFLGGVLFIFFISHSPEPESPTEVAANFLTAIEDHDYDEAKEFATSETQTQLDFMASLNEGVDNQEVSEEIYILSESIFEEEAIVTYAMGDRAEEYTLSLMRKGENWKVETTKEALAGRNTDKSSQEVLQEAVDEFLEGDTGFEETKQSIEVLKEKLGMLEDPEAEKPELGYIIADRVNLRSRPGTLNSEVIDKLDKGVECTILDTDYSLENTALVNKEISFYPIGKDMEIKIEIGKNRIRLQKGQAVEIIEDFEPMPGFSKVALKTKHHERMVGIVATNFLEMNASRLWYKILTSEGEEGWVLNKFIKIRSSTLSERTGNKVRIKSETEFVYDAPSMIGEVAFTVDKEMDFVILKELKIKDNYCKTKDKAIFYEYDRYSMEDPDFAAGIPVQKGTLLVPKGDIEEFELDGHLAHYVELIDDNFGNKTGLISSGVLDFGKDITWLKIKTKTGDLGYINKDKVSLK